MPFVNSLFTNGIFYGIMALLYGSFYQLVQTLLPLDPLTLTAL